MNSLVVNIQKYTIKENKTVVRSKTGIYRNVNSIGKRILYLHSEKKKYAAIKKTKRRSKYNRHESREPIPVFSYIKYNIFISGFPS